ncbi:MAG: hypothetical protein IT210_17305 [Armatimonadetes bacterium]|nr:hypothetical protein [Armatimonadota bacterium]
MNRSVSFSVQSASLPEALTHLARTAGVSVMLDHVGPVPSKRLSLSVDNAPLHDILDIIADAFGLRWHRHGVVYVLR